MAAIGPGSIVRAVRDGNGPGGRLTVGALYCVADVLPPTCEESCLSCREAREGIALMGKRAPVTETFAAEWCICAFRPWPPEPPSELLEEQETKEVIREGAL